MNSEFVVAFWICCSEVVEIDVTIEAKIRALYYLSSVRAVDCRETYFFDRAVFFQIRFGRGMMLFSHLKHRFSIGMRKPVLPMKYSRFLFSKEHLTSGLLNTVIRTTASVAANPVIKNDNQLHRESQGYECIFVQI